VQRRSALILIVGGMLERQSHRVSVPITSTSMHGSEKTVGFAGADALLKRLPG